jgi:hypothetical protein
VRNDDMRRVDENKNEKGRGKKFILLPFSVK